MMFSQEFVLLLVQGSFGLSSVHFDGIAIFSCANRHKRYKPNELIQ